MRNREYLKPTMTVTAVNSTGLLVGSEKEIPFNPEDGTEEALSKGADGEGVWD